MALIERLILPHVYKPGRYLGKELNAANKDFDTARVRMAVAFPDLYEIGFSNYGLKLLYSLVNHQPDLMCDRVYAPARDFKDELAKHQIPLYGVESKRPLVAFDCLAFSLQYELNYTTIFGMLESAQLPFRAAARQAAMAQDTALHYPLLIAGGPGSANPMPLAPFMDAFIIGDGEEVLLEILDLIDQGKRHGWRREALLDKLVGLEGVFVPGRTERTHKRIVDIAEKPVAMIPLVPYVEAVHDRVVVEARRGCDRMCRFCQPCFINLPVREQNVETIKQSALKGLAETGYEECSLLSLSIADFSHLKPMVQAVAGAIKEQNASLSLPSQRADRFNLDVATAVQEVRKSTLTFAPEAGTPRLRDVINKNLTDDEILNAVTTAYRAGWNKVKLYFMIGLPTETTADLDGIKDLVMRMRTACGAIRREPGPDGKKLANPGMLEVNVTLSNFVPKPHTPFQWFPQASMAEMRDKTRYLRDQFRGIKGIKLSFTDPEISKLEAVIAKGGVELAEVIEQVYHRGAYLDAWNDMSNFDKWFAVLAERGIDPEAYTRQRLVDPADPLPWDAIDVGLDKAWLQTEYERAQEAASTAPCFETCSECGVCPSLNTWPKFIDLSVAEKAAAAVKTSRPAAMSAEPVCRVRLQVHKMGGLRFISHLDWMRLLHRAFVQAKIPMAYTQGFNPRPKTSFTSALPLFVGSTCEMIEVWLTESVDLSTHSIKDRINPFLGPDGQVVDEVMMPVHGPSVSQLTTGLSYLAEWACQNPSSTDTLVDKVKQFWLLPSLWVNVKAFDGSSSPDLSQQANPPSHLVEPANSADTQTPTLATLQVLPSQVFTTELPPAIDTRAGQDGKQGAPFWLDLRRLVSELTVDLAQHSGNPALRITLHAPADGSRQVSAVKPQWLLQWFDSTHPWQLTRTQIHLKDAH
jgi:radical SAM-linked protein